MEEERPYLTGKIQIVKTFVIPRLMSKVSLIPVSDGLIKEINKLIYNFIWHGNDNLFLILEKQFVLEIANTRCNKTF